MKLLKKLKQIFRTKEPPTKHCKQEMEQTKIFKPVTWDTVAAECDSYTKSLGRLVYENSANEAINLELYTSRVNIGRMTSNELCIKDGKISRLHAFILYENGAHIVYDGKSLNGTFVNGEKITKHTLKTGDQIKVGNIIITYEVE